MRWSPVAAIRRPRAERVGTRQHLAVAEEGQEPVGVGVGAGVGRRLGHLGHRHGGAEWGLGRADCRCLRIGVGDPGYGAVVGLAGLAEDVGRDHTALVFADVGERPDARDVPDRPHPLSDTEPRVDRHTAGVGRDADGLQSDPIHPWAPAGRDQQPVGAQLSAAVESQNVVLAVPSGTGGVFAEHDLDAVAPQDLAECLTECGGLAGQHMGASLDEGHVPAELPNDLRDLDPHRPTAEHEQVARDLRHAGGLPAAPNARELSQPVYRRHERVGAVRQHDMPRVMTYTIDLDRAGAAEPPTAAQQIDALALQPGLLAGVRVVGDHEVSPCEHRLHVDLRGPRGVPSGMRGLAGTQERLRRDARPVRALAAHQLSLDDGDPQAAIGQRARAMLTRRAAAHHDHVVVGGHIGSS